MIPSFNVGETVSFFKTSLGFEIKREEPTYVILYKDNLTVHILPAGSDVGEMSFYLEVDDIDQLWNSINKLSGVIFKEPFNREYGMREAHIVVPQTKTLLFIGQNVQT